MTTQEILSNLFCSFAGTIGFAIMYNVPKKYYIGCGVTGMAGWIVYLLVSGSRLLFRGVYRCIDIKDVVCKDEMSDNHISDFRDFTAGTGCRHLQYGLLYRNEPTDTGSFKRNRVFEDSFCYCNGNCNRCIYTERCIS